MSNEYRQEMHDELQVMKHSEIVRICKHVIDMKEVYDDIGSYPSYAEQLEARGQYSELKDQLKDTCPTIYKDVSKYIER